MEHEWDEVHVKMSDSESVKAFCQRKGADRREKPEKALPKRKGGWKVRGPSHGGTEPGNPGQCRERGEEETTASLNSLSTSTGRWPIMAARCEAEYPELGEPAEPSGEKSSGENAASSGLTQKPATL